MKKKLFFRHYERQRKCFYLYFKRALESQAMEDLHRLRVSIKGLRSTWSLMEIMSQGKWSKKPHFEWIAKLFDRAGEVRETQVNIKLVKRYWSKYLATYLKDLQKIEKRTNKRLLKTMQSFDLGGLELFDRSIPKFIKDLSNEEALRESANYVLELDNRINWVKRLPPDTHKIHSMRIQLKIMYEILDFINNLKAKSGLRALQNNVNSVNHKIGDWHDYTILIRSLKHFVLRVPKKKVVRYLKGLAKDIESQQEKREKKIYKALNRYMTDKRRRLIESML